MATPPLRVNGITIPLNLDSSPNPATLTYGDVSGDANKQVMETLAPSEAGASTWYDTIAGVLFHGTRKDQVRTFGWNLVANGPRPNTSEAAIGLSFESYYEQDASNTWLEAHLISIDTNGNTVRPWTFQVGRTGGTASNGGVVNGTFAVDSLAINDSNIIGSQNNYFSFQSTHTPGSGALLVGGGSNGMAAARISEFSNNVKWLSQMNAARTNFLSLAYLDASNNVNVGVGSTGGGDAAGVIIGGSAAVNTIAGTAQTINGTISQTGFAKYTGTTSSVPSSVLTSMSLLNSWVYFGSDSTPTYFKDTNGVVHLKGVVKLGTTLGAVITNMPAGYRPLANALFPATSNGVFCQIQVGATGDVANVSGTGSTAYVALDGISYLAEQ